MNWETLSAFIVILGILIVLIWFIPKWQLASQRSKLAPEDYLSLENSARSIVAQIMGGIVLLLGLYYTAENLRTVQESAANSIKRDQENFRLAQEGQITDRFAKAISQLGDSKLEIRLGAIYSLERISIDSEKDYWAVMEVLSAYVREKVPYKSGASGSNQSGRVRSVSPPPIDVQAILKVIGRRNIKYENAKQRVDLSNTDLRYADLSEAGLINLSFIGANLEGAQLNNSILDHSILGGAILRFANLKGASLKGAYFGYAQHHADLKCAYMNGADLTGAAGLNWDMLSSAYLNIDTRLPSPDFERFREDYETPECEQD